MTVLVSVIVPAYNQAKYLEYALDSVRQQTFENFECIIVNDGSTDNTEEIAKKFVTDKRFKYIFQKNRGLAGARNTGINASQGDYIGFLDADDLWEPQMLEKTVYFLERNPEISIVSGLWDIIDESGKIISRKSRPVTSGNYLNDLIMGNRFPVHALLLRKKVFLTCGLFDINLRACEDWDMWLRAASNGHNFGCIDNLICHYRRHTNCMTLDIERMRSSYLYVLEKFFNEQNNPDITKLKSYSYIFQWLHLAASCKEAKKFDELKDCLKEAERIFLKVRYTRKYSKLMENALEYLPYSSDFLNRIYFSKPIIWKLEEPSRGFGRKADDSFRNKKYLLSFYYKILSSICWPPRIIEYKGLIFKIMASKFSLEAMRTNQYIFNELVEDHER